MNPCSGSTSESAMICVLIAMTAQRNMPAAAASAAAFPGPRRLRRAGPRRKNMITSAATDSDQIRLAVPVSMPAAFQLITAKLSCIA